MDRPMAAFSRPLAGSMDLHDSYKGVILGILYRRGVIDMARAKKGKDGVTDKQRLFCHLHATVGYSLYRSYSEAFDSENMKEATIRREASRLIANNHAIATLCERLSMEKQRIAHSQALTQSVSDRDRVLSKLRHYTDHAESEANAIRAVVELGRTCQVFTDQVEVKSQRSSEDVLTQLEQKLEMLNSLPADQESEQVH